MYDEQNNPPLNSLRTMVAKQPPPTSPIVGALLPRCSMTTFLHRIAFTVWHAALHLERVGQEWVFHTYLQTNHLYSLLNNIQHHNRPRTAVDMATLYSSSRLL